MIFLRTSILQNNSWELLLRRKQLNLIPDRNELKNVFFLVSFLIYERRTFLCSTYVVGCLLCKFQHRNTIAQKMKFSIKDFFSKCDQIRSIPRIWSHLLKKSLMENFIFLRSVLFSLKNIYIFFSQWMTLKLLWNIMHKSIFNTNLVSITWVQHLYCLPQKGNSSEICYIY